MTAAIYCRLSREDEEKQSESESIQNQKSMLIHYAVEKGYDIYQIYCDEDYSGIDRARPAFNRMIEAAGQHARIVGRDLGAGVKAFLEIGRCAALQRLGAQRLIAAIAAGELFVHGQLFGHGQVKEALAGGKQAADQCRVYAMAGDIEEAALFASLAQLLGHQVLIHGVMAAQATDVDEGEGRDAHKWRPETEELESV